MKGGLQEEPMARRKKKEYLVVRLKGAKVFIFKHLTVLEICS